MYKDIITSEIYIEASRKANSTILKALSKNAHSLVALKALHLDDEKFIAWLQRAIEGAKIAHVTLLIDIYEKYQNEYYRLEREFSTEY